VSGGSSTDTEDSLRRELLRLCGALQIAPENAAQLYQLVLGAEQIARGESIPRSRSPATVRRWLSSVTHASAALPGLFVDEVLTPAGGRLVLPGSFEDAHWSLEILLVELVSGDHNLSGSFVAGSLSIAQALLDLSHTVAEEAGLSAPLEHEHRPGQEVLFPTGACRKRLLASVTFTMQEFESATGATVDELLDHALFVDDVDLERVPYLSRPLAMAGDNVIVIQPTALAHAAAQAIVRDAERQGCRGELAKVWQSAVDRAVGGSLARLALLVQRSPEPGWPAAPFACTEVLHLLDRDKLLHVVTPSDDLTRVRTSTDELAWRGIPAGVDVADFLTSRTFELFNIDGLEVPVNGLLQLVIVQPLSASFDFVLPPLPADPPVERLVLSAHELNALARGTEGADVLSLWHIATALREARRHVPIAPVSQLEEYAWLRQHGWTYTHLELGEKTGAIHLLGFARDLHVELAVRWRPRVVPGPGGEGWVRVVLAHPEAEVPIRVHDLPAVGRPAVAFTAPKGWHAWIMAADPMPPPASWQEAYQWVSLVAYWFWHVLPQLTATGDGTLTAPPVVRIGPAEAPDDDAAWIIRTGQGLVDVELHPAGVDALGEPNNRAERFLMRDLLGALMAVLGQDPETAGRDVALDAVGVRHGITLWQVDDPVAVPGLAPYRHVNDWEDLRARRMVGRHLVDKGLAEAGAGPAPTTAAVLKMAVERAYEELTLAVARLEPDGLLEWLVGMNESVTTTNIARQLEASAQAFAGTPVDASTTRNEDLERPVHRTAVALRFILEYVAARPPAGRRPISYSAYDELLALAAFIVRTGATSDVLQHGLDEPEVAVGPDLAFHVAASRYSAGFAGFVTATWQDAVDDGIDFLLERDRHVDSAEIDHDESASVDQAFADETGFTLSDHARFRACLLDLVGDEDSYSGPLDQTAALVIEKLGWEPARVKDMLEQLALQPRADFLDPPRGHSRTDVYPWRFGRTLSHLRRPLVIRPRPAGDGRDLLFGPRHLSSSWTYDLNALVAGRYPARGAALKREMTAMQQAESRAFNDRVAEHFEQIAD
jgi:hypothetical protein